MKLLSVEQLAIPEIRVIRYGRFGDNRGYFTEHFRHSDFHTNPDLPFMRDVEFLQTNESYSRTGTIRGMHFQWNPFQGKLVRTLSGHMFDLALDIRPGSPTFGMIIAHDMPADPEAAAAEWIWLPPGFGHGIIALEPTTIEYFCSSEWSPGCEGAISPLASDLDWSRCDPELKATFDRIAATTTLITAKDRDGLSMAAWRADERSAMFAYDRLREVE